MRLLFVEDEKRLLEALSHLLKKNGYMVDLASDGEMGLEMAFNGTYDIIILDRMLPKIDGLTILREFRKQGFDTPVLFLTAKDLPQNRVEGLDAGADDYLIKPFSTEELFARLRALGRRKNKEFIGDSITVGDLTLYPLKGQVAKGDELIQLTVKESLVLELLMRNNKQVVTKECILEKVWGFYSEISISNVDLYVYYLRKKLPGSYIKTIRGVGYCIEGEKDV